MWVIELKRILLINKLIMTTQIFRLEKVIRSDSTCNAKQSIATTPNKDKNIKLLGFKPKRKIFIYRNEASEKNIKKKGKKKTFKSSSTSSIKVQSNIKINYNNEMLNGFRNGRWMATEHNRFLKGCLLYGNNWKKV